MSRWKQNPTEQNGRGSAPKKKLQISIDRPYDLTNRLHPFPPHLTLRGKPSADVLGPEPQTAPSSHATWSVSRYCWNFTARPSQIVRDVGDLCFAFLGVARETLKPKAAESHNSLATVARKDSRPRGLKTSLSKPAVKRVGKASSAPPLSRDTGCGPAPNGELSAHDPDNVVSQIYDITAFVVAFV